MSTNSVQIKSHHLGMPHGTAQNRLRKNIVFSLLQRLNENVCFKCGQTIETAEDLSIEHKVPWLYGAPDLFWNLDNIAFSHRRCNRPDRPRGTQPKPAPPGQAWCSGCKRFLDAAHFNKNRSRWNGLQKQCRSCHAKM